MHLLYLYYYNCHKISYNTCKLTTAPWHINGAINAISINPHRIKSNIRVALVNVVYGHNMQRWSVCGVRLCAIGRCESHARCAPFIPGLAACAPIAGAWSRTPRSSIVYRFNSIRAQPAVEQTESACTINDLWSSYGRCACQHRSGLMHIKCTISIALFCTCTTRCHLCASHGMLANNVAARLRAMSTRRADHHRLAATFAREWENKHTSCKSVHARWACLTEKIALLLPAIQLWKLS